MQCVTKAFECRWGDKTHWVWCQGSHLFMKRKRNKCEPSSIFLCSFLYYFSSFFVLHKYIFLCCVHSLFQYNIVTLCQQHNKFTSNPSIYNMLFFFSILYIDPIIYFCRLSSQVNGSYVRERESLYISWMSLSEPPTHRLFFLREHINLYIIFQFLE